MSTCQSQMLDHLAVISTSTPLLQTSANLDLPIPHLLFFSYCLITGLFLCKIELNQETKLHTLTCVCFEAIITSCGAERARFTGNVKSIKNCSCWWRDATWRRDGIRRCISSSWFSWLRTWYRQSELGKTWLCLPCKKEKNIYFVNQFISFFQSKKQKKNSFEKVLGFKGVQNGAKPQFMQTSNLHLKITTDYGM